MPRKGKVKSKKSLNSVEKVEDKLPRRYTENKAELPDLILNKPSKAEYQSLKNKSIGPIFPPGMHSEREEELVEHLNIHKNNHIYRLVDQLEIINKKINIASVSAAEMSSAARGSSSAAGSSNIATTNSSGDLKKDFPFILNSLKTILHSLSDEIKDIQYNHITYQEAIKNEATARKALSNQLSTSENYMKVKKALDKSIETFEACQGIQRVQDCYDIYRNASDIHNNSRIGSAEGMKSSNEIATNRINNLLKTIYNLQTKLVSIWADEINSLVTSSNSKRKKVSSSNLDGKEVNSSNLDGKKVSSSNLDGKEISSSNLDGKKVSSSNLNGKKVSSSNMNGKEVNPSNLNGKEVNSSNLDAKKVSLSNLDGKEVSTSNLDGKEVSTSNLNGKKVIPSNPNEQGYTIFYRKCLLLSKKLTSLKSADTKFMNAKFSLYQNIMNDISSANEITILVHLLKNTITQNLRIAYTDIFDNKPNSNEINYDTEKDENDLDSKKRKLNEDTENKANKKIKVNDVKNVIDEKAQAYSAASPSGILINTAVLKDIYNSIPKDLSFSNHPIFLLFSERKFSAFSISNEIFVKKMTDILIAHVTVCQLKKDYFMIPENICEYMKKLNYNTPLNSNRDRLLRPNL